jgi:hypothetical protein
MSEKKHSSILSQLRESLYWILKFRHTNPLLLSLIPYIRNFATGGKAAGPLTIWSRTRLLGADRRFEAQLPL